MVREWTLPKMLIKAKEEERLKIEMEKKMEEAKKSTQAL